MKTTSKLSAVTFAVLLSLTLPAMARDTTPTPQANDVTARFADGSFNISGLRAIEIGGIVVLRGQTTNPAEAARVGDFAHNLGYERVANVVTIASQPDDEAIERSVERALASHRTLDGCTFHVDSQQGVVRVAGRVQYELQKDVATDLIRGIDGVRAVRMEATR